MTKYIVHPVTAFEGRSAATIKEYKKRLTKLNQARKEVECRIKVNPENLDLFRELNLIMYKIEVCESKCSTRINTRERCSVHIRESSNLF